MNETVRIEEQGTVAIDDQFQSMRKVPSLKHAQQFIKLSNNLEKFLTNTWLQKVNICLSVKMDEPDPLIVQVSSFSIQLHHYRITGLYQPHMLLPADQAQQWTMDEPSKSTMEI